MAKQSAYAISMSNPTADKAAPTAWVVTDGSAGMEIQCIGLAKALKLDYSVKRIATTKPWKWLPPALWLDPLNHLSPSGDQLTAPWPDVLISCGRQSIPLNMAVKKASAQKTFTIHIQTPNTSAANFDLVIVPEHDKLRGDNVLVCEGALSPITPEVLEQAALKFEGVLEGMPTPVYTVLIGGSNGCYNMTAEVMTDLVSKLAKLHQKTGCSFLVTTSRRTGPENEAILKSALDLVPHRLWTGDGDNPYFGFLALAEAIIVTPDSVNMVCEACSMGKPVYVFDLPGGNQKFNHFHRRMRDLGYTRPFVGLIEDWSATPLLETQKIADEVAKHMVGAPQ
ncbi:MAG: mitochondrial fission ELM1 family protein [Proteobacteria bacterium]|nr:mitochondrial fission ELM1 family protein [Pseudomonadota bacterium]